MSNKPYKVPIPESVNRIQLCYDKESKVNGQGPLAKASSKHYSLSDLLGNPQQYWWRAYINPKHYDEALKEFPDNPGIAYDIDCLSEYSAATPGYQAQMESAFKQYLDMKEPTSVALDYETYESMYKAVSIDYGKGKYYIRGAVDAARYPTATKLATDLGPEPTGNVKLTEAQRYEMDLLGKRLALTLEETKTMEKVQSWTSQMKLGGADTPMIMYSLGCSDWSKPVNEVFTDFTGDMKNAKSRIQQLQAIARCVRRVHMLHFGGDGNKRLNVHLLLNHLLLRYGFGLPFGGKYRQELNKPEALDEIFQGGYTVEEIAKFLWVAQDFGLKSKNHSDTILGAEAFTSTHDDTGSGSKHDIDTSSETNHKGENSSPATKSNKDKTVQSQAGLRATNGDHAPADGKDHPSKKPAYPSNSSAGTSATNRGHASTNTKDHRSKKPVHPSNSATPHAPRSDIKDQPSPNAIARTMLGTESQPATAHVYVNALTTISHNGDHANVTGYGSQTVLSHNGTQTTVNHAGNHSTITHAGNTSAATVLTHPDGAHTTVSSANNTTTVTHHQAGTPASQTHGSATTSAQTHGSGTSGPPTHQSGTPLPPNNHSGVPVPPVNHSGAPAPSGHHSSTPVAPTHQPVAPPPHNAPVNGTVRAPPNSTMIYSSGNDWYCSRMVPGALSYQFNPPLGPSRPEWAVELLAREIGKGPASTIDTIDDQLIFFRRVPNANVNHNGGNTKPAGANGDKPAAAAKAIPMPSGHEIWHELFENCKVLFVGPDRIWKGTGIAAEALTVERDIIKALAMPRGLPDLPDNKQ